jgi:predicted ATPase
VEEGSLRFHVAGLRKALGDGKDGARYIATIPGRGYCFVAPISLSAVASHGEAAAATPFKGVNFLPTRLERMVGRAGVVAELSAQVAASRFVTIVGSGGVGKTTVAVAVAHDLLESFAGAAIFVDFSMLSDPDIVPVTLASMLGLSVQSADPTPSLIAYLHDRQLLLILDNCEHVIEAAASLAERIFLAAPQVYILTTSREPLRVEGERVHRLAPLTVPPGETGLAMADALTFPAIQLFLERAAASGARLDLCDEDAAIITHICRKLDGVALAIELAAGRVEAYGLRQTAALLDERLALLWYGQRMAPPRQKTLYAALDWSYGLLSEAEGAVLRRLAVFVGHFTLEAALAVITSELIDHVVVMTAIDSLVAKSMVATRPIGGMMRYRLLDTTRTYALEISTDETGSAKLAARHATYYQRSLEQPGVEWPTLSNATERASRLADLNNVRAALEWCFGSNGDPDIGVRLAAAAAPVFLATSLLPECHRWSERAILALDDATRGAPEEMHLQAALGLTLMVMRGESDAARRAVSRSLTIAEEHGDTLNEMNLLGLLHMFHHRSGDFTSALEYARRSFAVSGVIDDPSAATLAHCALGVSLHHMGHIGSAGVELAKAVQHRPGSHRVSTIYLGFDHRNWAGATLARNLWLQGYSDRAVELARQCVDDAVAIDRPVTLAIALNCAVTVFLWTGDLQSAERHIEWLFDHAEAHSLATFLAAGKGFRGQLAICRGNAQDGVELLQGCLEELHAARYALLASSFSISLAQGLAAIGQHEHGLALIDERIGLDEANQAHSYLPELLRVKGGVLLSMPNPMLHEAEICLTQSLDWSSRLGAPAWELRTASDLAALWIRQGQLEPAEALLRPMLERFDEGADTADMKVAGRLLATLS